MKALACFQFDLDRWMPGVFEALEREAEPIASNAYPPSDLFQLRPPAFSSDALPTLVAALGSRHRDVRRLAASLLGALGPDATGAIPDLINAMSNPIDTAMVGPGKTHPSGWDTGWWAAHALGKIAPGTSSAGPVIQTLTDVVRSGHPYRRDAATIALCDFGPTAVAAVPALIAVLKQNARTKAAFDDGADAAIALP
jgi:HEAT repeat protein